MTLVELQNRDNNNIEIVDEDYDVEIELEDDGEFIAIDTGIAENYEEIEQIAPVVVPQTPVGYAATPFQKGADEDIFDILENLENAEPQNRRGDPVWSPAETIQSGMAKFIASLNEEEHTALEMLLSAKSDNKSFDILCGEFLSQRGVMVEFVVDALNEKAMDFTGDIVFDTGSCEIVEDYRGDIEEYLKKND